MQVCYVSFAMSLISLAPKSCMARSGSHCLCVCVCVCVWVEGLFGRAWGIRLASNIVAMFSFWNPDGM